MDSVGQVLPLRLIDFAEEDQCDPLFELMFKLPHLVHHYLSTTVFPEVVGHHGRKLLASTICCRALQTIIDYCRSLQTIITIIVDHCRLL